MTSVQPVIDRDRDAEVDASDARFASLFRAHYSRVRRWVCALGLRAEADDAAQEVFLIAHRRLDSLRAEASVRAWLYSITRGVCANHRRGRDRERNRRSGAPLPSCDDDPEQATARREAATMLQHFLDELPHEQCEAFVLYDVEGMRAPEVAATLGIDAELVHSRVRSAREKLRRFVDRQRAKSTRKGRTHGA